MGICCNTIDRRKSESKSSFGGGSISSKSSNYTNTEVSNYGNLNSK
mgnify:CR=1 FL=1